MQTIGNYDAMLITTYYVNCNFIYLCIFYILFLFFVKSMNKYI